MKLSTLQMTSTIELVAERFVKSNSSVELVLTARHISGVALTERAIVCDLGRSSEAKTVQYFRNIENNIIRIANLLIIQMNQDDLFKDIFIDQETICTFILGGIFDSY